MGWCKIHKLEYLENGTFFLRNKKNVYLYLCLRWHILRSYRFVAEVNFKYSACFMNLNCQSRNSLVFLKFQNYTHLVGEKFLLEKNLCKRGVYTCVLNWGLCLLKKKWNYFYAFVKFFLRVYRTFSGSHRCTMRMQCIILLYKKILNKF